MPESTDSGSPGGSPENATLPLVSVVMPVYNAGTYLRPAVMSIIDQTYAHFEFLIFDDGSTDGCMDSIADIDDPRIRIVTQPNAGKPAVLNRALQTIQGEFFAIQDADDLSHPKRVELQVKALRENPRLAAVLTGNELILNGRLAAPSFAPRSEEHCRLVVETFRQPAHDPTVMFRTDMVRSLKYDTSLEICEGHDFILKVGEKHPMCVLGECLYSYRVHNESITARTETRQLFWKNEVRRRACERRGLAPPDPIVVDGLDTEGIKQRSIVAHFLKSVVDLRQAGYWWSALTTALLCVRARPSDLYYYRPLVYVFTPLRLIDRHRRRRGRSWWGKASSQSLSKPLSLLPHAPKLRV